MPPALSGIFVVGTDTGVGKTHIAAALTRAIVRDGRKVGVLKPVATGATQSPDGWICDDAARLIAALENPAPLERVVPLLYSDPLAPSLAARRAGKPLSQAHVEAVTNKALAWWSERVDVIVVEGIGGLLCPLAEGTTLADLAVALDFPLLIVARRGLGTLNHTLLTVEAANFRSLRIAGIVLNSPEPQTDSLAEALSAQELSRRLPGIAVLAEIDHQPDAAWPDSSLFVNWYQQARPSRFPAQP